ncbi:MAG: metallopeptidase family protein [Patescibacteria group bacterium]|nr:metallopeptidase family protein [Patescibacteria group bacterium]
MEKIAFKQLVADAFDDLPDQFRKLVDNVALLVEDEPSEEVRAGEGLGEHETLFGLYAGIPQTGRDHSYGVGGTLPDTITIYQNPIEEEARGDEERCRSIIYETVWHEIAHHFGMDEEAVRKREQERKIKHD